MRVWRKLNELPGVAPRRVADSAPCRAHRSSRAGEDDDVRRSPRRCHTGITREPVGEVGVDDARDGLHGSSSAQTAEQTTLDLCHFRVIGREQLRGKRGGEAAYSRSEGAHMRKAITASAAILL